MPSPSWSFRGSPGQESHASPRASPSALAWVGFATVGQLSQASPRASVSELVWDGLATVGQLSFWPVLGGANPAPAQMPSPSGSFWGSPGHESQASPSASPSASAWLVFDG